jgi:hypothetical protein
MIGKYAAVVAIGALCIAGQASAKDAAMAQLSAVKGSVMVNQGGKMVPATAGALRAGDRVVAANGSARLAYADGCVVSLQSNAMATIGAASPCATGAGLVGTQGAAAQSEMGMTGLQLVGSIVAVGVLAVGIASTADNEDEVTSP